MIRVTVSGTRLTLEGHAGSGPFGQDLVCAAASTLALTLAQNVKRLHRQGLAADAVILLEPGYGEISCTPGNREAVKAVFTVIVTGFRLLSQRYPEHIRLQVL